MAYKDHRDTDPLGVMIGRQRSIRQLVLFAMLLWFVPSLVQFVFSYGPQLTSVTPTNVARPSTVGPAVASNPPASSTARANAGSTKLSARGLEQLLNSSPMSNPAPRNVRCLAGRAGWDYTCTYETDVPHPRSRHRIGVRVNATGIIQASAPHRFSDQLPPPAN